MLPKSVEFVTGAQGLVAVVEGKSFEEIVTKALPESEMVKGIKPGSIIKF